MHIFYLLFMLECITATDLLFRISSTNAVAPLSCRVSMASFTAPVTPAHNIYIYTMCVCVCVCVFVNIYMSSLLRLIPHLPYDQNEHGNDDQAIKKQAKFCQTKL